MKNFHELNLSEPISRAIAELGYETPTEIQAEALPLLLGADTDFLGLAATGTGKTAAFGIPLLERLDEDTRGVQALILCPTRELAMQVAGQIDLLGQFKGVKSLPIYGGTGYAQQIQGLRAGANIVVGTPGRVVDHINKGYLNLSKLKTLILDEADEMISMGFQEDLEAVLKAAPKDQANIWLFSATMGAEVRHVANSYLRNPQKVQVNKTDMLPNTVEQFYFKVHEYDKPDVLRKLIDAAEDFYGIVFCQTKALVIDVTAMLSSKGYSVDCLHGDMDQTARDRVMKAFRDRKIAILVATDVACRGLDVKDVTHVVNYSIPRELDNYVHRIGRTGRSGKTGIAFSLVTFSHRELIGRIERMTKTRMQEAQVPTAKDIAFKRVAKVRGAFDTRGPQGRVETMLDDSWKALLEPLSKEDIAARFLALLCPDLGAPERTEESRPAKRENTVRPPREDRPQRPSGFRKEFKKSFKPRGESRPFEQRKPYGEKPFHARRERSSEGIPSLPGERKFSGERKAFERKPFDKKPFDKKPFDKKPFEKKPFKKFSARSEAQSETRTPPWERKHVKRDAPPASAPPPKAAQENGPRWKSPGTAKLGAKPRWKINPSSQ